MKTMRVEMLVWSEPDEIVPLRWAREDQTGKLGYQLPDNLINGNSWTHLVRTASTDFGRVIGYSSASYFSQPDLDTR